jgi:hypothetical protein
VTYGVPDDLSDLVGKTVKAIEWGEENLVFSTDDGVVAYQVDGDCCSRSYFHDFYGVAHLLNNGPVVSAREIPLDSHEGDYDEIKCYGYELVTTHPKWGEVTSVLSFRNSSNGYYGGWMYRTDHVPSSGVEVITTDQVGG